MILGVIPARLNSKRLKKKNIINFFGKPLISYSISAAIKSKIFDKIIVSTESEKIVKIATKYGAECPFLRPKKLSSDRVWPSEVVKHAIEWSTKNYSKPKFICLIYPTAPLLQPIDLINSFNIIKKKKYKCVFSAVKNSYPIQRSFYLNKKKEIVMVNKKFFYKRSQDLQESFHDAGQFAWGSYDAWVKNKINFSKTSKFYLLPRLRVQDIDNYDDLETAKRLYIGMISGYKN
tara:strand:+ start:639 stop:1337 length:699 start_codon:yes stop_codon:yes gene_type:complete